MTASDRTDENRVLIYGFISGDGDSVKNISTLTFAGVTDDGERVSYNARYTNNGMFYLANLKSGRYIATELVFKDDGGTMTFYLDKKNSFYRTKEAITKGFDVKPGRLHYIGNLKISRVPGRPTDPAGTFYFRYRYENDPKEIDALESLAELIKQGPWYDLALEKRTLLAAQ